MSTNFCEKQLCEHLIIIWSWFGERIDANKEHLKKFLILLHIPAYTHTYII